MKMSERLRGYSIVALGLLALAIFAPVGNATMLAPGESVCAAGCTFTPINDFAAGFFFTSSIADTGPIALVGKDGLGVTQFTGTLEEWVANDVNTGGLDFLYQVINTTARPLTDHILQVSVASYEGSTTDVGYCSNPGGGGAVPCGNPLGGPNGTSAPIRIDRSTAATVDFSVDLAPGVTSYDLVVKTNAMQFGGGTTQVFDNGVAAVVDLAPIPEPVSAGLLLGGLFGVGLFVAGDSGCRRTKKLVGYSNLCFSETPSGASLEYGKVKPPKSS